MRIAMIGSGYVGLVSGACFADFGHEVTCIDKDAGKIEALRAGRMPIFEPGLDELVARNVAQGRLSFDLDLDAAVRAAQAVFIGVGTPSRRGDGHADLLRAMRVAALAAMEMLDAFTPRLVGPVLNGTADENSAVNLHVFADAVETVADHLDANGVVWRAYERRLKYRRDRPETCAGFEFKGATGPIQATVFPVDGIRQAPLSPIDGRPMDRADAARVRDLIDRSEGSE